MERIDPWDARSPFDDYPSDSEPPVEHRVPQVKPAVKGSSDGGSTSYYDLPEGAVTLMDLIEAREMGFSLGNIFKAAYRLGRKDGTDPLYDLNKIIYFATRLKEREERMQCLTN